MRGIPQILFIPLETALGTCAVRMEALVDAYQAELVLFLLYETLLAPEDLDAHFRPQPGTQLAVAFKYEGVLLTKGFQDGLIEERTRVKGF